jgi:hypothetical protein
MNEIELLRSFRDTPAVGAEEVARAARRVLHPQSRRRSVLVPVVGLALAIAAIAAVGLSLQGGDDNSLGTIDAQAAETLRQAASSPLSGPSRPLRPGEYWYVQRRTRWFFEAGDRYRFIQPQIREDWVGADGSRRWRTAPQGPPIFPTRRDHERWIAGGRLRGGLGKTSDHRVGPPAGPAFFLGNDGYSYRQLANLPLDPARLYQRLHTAAKECDCGQSVNQETFVMVGDLLRDPPLPKDLRAALLRAAARIPGIDLVSDTRDLDGRPGIGVTYGEGSQASTLVFDRRTHEFLGETDGRGNGSVDLRSGIVSSLAARP